MNKKTRNIGMALGVLAAIAILAVASNVYTDIATTTKSPTYSAMFGNFVEIGADWNPGPGSAKIINVSFYLPVDAYIYVSSSGEVSFVSGGVSKSGSAAVWIAIDDKNKAADWDTYRFHEGGFSVSSMYKLKKGHHTAYVMGRPRDGSYTFGYVSANVVVIATQEGTIGKNGWFIQ